MFQVREDEPLARIGSAIIVVSSSDVSLEGIWRRTPHDVQHMLIRNLIGTVHWIETISKSMPSAESTADVSDQEGGLSSLSTGES